MKAIDIGLHVQTGASNKRGQYFTWVLSITIYFVRSPRGAAYHNKCYCSDYMDAKILYWGFQDSRIRTSGSWKPEVRT